MLNLQSDLLDHRGSQEKDEKAEEDVSSTQRRDSSDGSCNQVIVGICAMEKKSLSKPMREILTRIEEFEYITTTIFPENIILNVSIITQQPRYKELLGRGQRIRYGKV